MKFIKKINELISKSSYSKLFSMVELSKGDIYYRIFYTPIQKKIVSIEATKLSNINIPFKEGDNIEKVFNWISENDDVELLKIRRKK